ncbi:hypothetical protein ACRAWF_46760 [Streptomyces sp. L7]
MGGRRPRTRPPPGPVAGDQRPPRAGHRPTRPPAGPVHRLAGATSAPTPPRSRPGTTRRRELASVDLTAGWHYCGGAEEGIFGHSATASSSPPADAMARQAPTWPANASAATPSSPSAWSWTPRQTRRPERGADTLTRLASHGLSLPAGLLAADRAYTDQLPAHFAVPARRQGLPTRPRLQTGTPRPAGLHRLRCSSRRRLARLPRDARHARPRHHEPGRQSRTRSRRR